MHFGSRLSLAGHHLERWLLLLFVSVTVAGLGLAFLIRDLYIGARLPQIVYFLALTFLPDWVRGLLLLAVGLLLSWLAVRQLSRAVLTSFLPGQMPPGNLDMVDTVLRRQARRQGPRVVALGGGTGMPALLRGLREYTDHITAVVTVADDGGSSGRLRRQTGMLPPGDFRNNIAALSEAEDLMTRLFQYRFPDPVADDDGDGLAGHSFGNLFITTMAAVTGSFESGIAESSRVLAVRGRVLPSTLEQITLCAEISRATADGDQEWLVVEGESKIPEAGGQIERIFLKPEQPRAYPLTVQAILQADLIIAGPGSFYTSVLPNLLVPDIQAAICATSAPCIYVCNVATQPGETDGYTVSDHMHQLRRHVGNAFTTVLANDNFSYRLEPGSRFVSEWVPLPQPDEALDYRLFTGDLADARRPWRHDPRKLAARLMALYQELRGERG
jgi:uncharacterized cofD-like protein